MSDKLFPKKNAPYLIVAPQYTSMSAGVHVLHNLCRTLNLIGERAYITTFPQLVIDGNQDAYTCPDLCTPIMTQQILDFFESEDRHPIVVYLEAVRGNPLNGSHVVRYALNYPGLLGGDTQYNDNEILYAYSTRIAQHMNIGKERILFMPVSDPAIFYPPEPGTIRNGSCFYAAKYRDFHKGKLQPITDGSTEITRYQPDSPTKQQIADLFRRSEVFYTYEDTALAIEAALCGCPVVFLPNEFLKESIGLLDIGIDGIAWGSSPEELARAKATIHLFRTNYQGVIDRYWLQLQLFVEHTQKEVVNNKRQRTAITLPSSKGTHTIKYLIDYLQQYGFRRFIFKAVGFIRKSGVRRIFGNLFKNSIT